MTRQKSFAVFLCVMLLAQIVGAGAAELPMEPVPLEASLPVEATVTEVEIEDEPAQTTADPVAPDLTKEPSATAEEPDPTETPAAPTAEPDPTETPAVPTAEPDPTAEPAAPTAEPDPTETPAVPTAEPDPTAEPASTAPPAMPSGTPDPQTSVPEASPSPGVTEEKTSIESAVPENPSPSPDAADAQEAVTPSPEPTQAPAQRDTPSKALPMTRSLSALASEAEAASLAVSAMDAWVTVTPIYHSYVDGDSGVFVIEAGATGATGMVLYAFDVYLGNLQVEFMDAYQYANNLIFTATDPGNYTVKAYVYDIGTGTEKILSADFSFSTLTLGTFDPNVSAATTGDRVTWTVNTRGEFGELAYYYLIVRLDDAGAEEVVAFSGAYLPSNSYSMTLNRSGIYMAYVYVWEKSLSPRDFIFISSQVCVADDPSRLVFENISCDVWSAIPGESATWTAYVTGTPRDALEFEYHVYNNGVRMYSVDWTRNASFTYAFQRSGRYTLEVFARDTGAPDMIYSRISDPIGVSGLTILDVSVSKQVAYLGDSVTWTALVSGGSGDLYGIASVYETTSWNFLESTGLDENLSGSCVMREPGDILAVLDVYDENKSVFYFSALTTVSQRPAPILSPIVPLSAYSLRVAWGAVTGATAYVLERSTASAGPYDQVYLGAAQAFTDSKLSPGAVYYYRVRAQRLAEDGYTYEGLTSGTKAGVPLAGSAILNADAVSATGIKLTWAAVTGATGYELWRSTSRTGTYTRIYAGTARTFTNNYLKAGTPYYYKVRAYKTVGTVKYYGVYGAVRIGVPLAKPAVPAIVVSSPTSVTVSWTAVSGATGYELWRATSAAGTYARVYRGTAQTFRNLSLGTGTAYYYKVRAYKLVGTASYYSPYSGYKSVIPK